MSTSDAETMHALESYVIRIYRRDTRDLHEIAGIVERMEDGKRLTFSNAGELLDILDSGRPPKRRAAPPAKQS